MKPWKPRKKKEESKEAPPSKTEGNNEATPPPTGEEKENGQAPPSTEVSVQLAKDTKMVGLFSKSKNINCYSVLSCKTGIKYLAVIFIVLDNS